jgi:AMMECR1 domain-containing protein
VLALACAAVLASADRARAGAELDAYRAFARSDGSARLLAIARAALRHDTAAADTSAPEWPGPPCGVYLTLVRGAETRACVGSDAPLRGSLVETVRVLAGEALTADRRRPPVRAAELDSLTVVIAFAGHAEPIADPMLVNPARDGLRVSSGRGSIAFIPGEARTVAWALREARRAGVLEGAVANASYARFEAVVIRERWPARAGAPGALPE